MKNTRRWRSYWLACRWRSATPMPTITMSHGLSAEASSLPTWASGSSASTFSRAGTILPPFSSGHDSPCSLLTVALGWLIYVYGSRIGGPWGGILPLIAYVTAPVFLMFGPLVLTDLAITLFSLWTLWRFAELWQNPSRRNKAWFAIALAGALLSKFSAGTSFLRLPRILAQHSLARRTRPADNASRKHVSGVALAGVPLSLECYGPLQSSTLFTLFFRGIRATMRSPCWAAVRPPRRCAVC